ncbi:GGDEF domain-containing protein [Colwellia sp. 4_MG-2023]|uniref:GGDEF domain-containing protein n=1 Tax=unclassified Colwellia TaxID=196834 RepID=UPI0026E28A08|nr:MULTISPECIES: GGDEF domain-containing protein [unclassified Colwellia]MDO6506021.1 GGDEF domain-containing protein [Colwellia sp. 5_MG-2023]MDO6554919.1 GGDEF domain-containing protein [Colwellia sp. 4_MG-2023]
MQATIQSIVSNKLITTVFQPIFDVENEIIVGYEALSRGPKNTDFYSPEALFLQAQEDNLLSELELLCRASAITRFVELKLAGKLFINICLNVMLNKDHPHGETIKLVEQAGLSPQQVVIEISEKSPFPNNDILLKALNKYRKFGFDIAIDDVGVGYSGLKQWSYLRPDIVKIDRYFIDRCDQDVMKREFLKTLFELGRISNAHIIAEGIETKEEFELLRELGMVYSQGFFLAKPSENPIRCFPVLDISSSIELQSNVETIASLVTATTTVDYNQNVNYVYELFTQNLNVHAIPVLHDDKPLGMIFRNQLMESYSDIYGRALFSKKSARDIMSNTPMIIEHSMPLEQVSALLTARANSEFTQPSIITEHGKYIGVVSPRDLLRSITESKLEQARYANPLTGLPGNVVIEKEIDYMLNKKKPFNLAYLDLNHFKPFNDIYGYAKGDLLLKTLANCIMINTNNKHCFVGHIGGDDFIIMFKSNDVELVCQKILGDFAKQSLSFITKEHQDQQGYNALDRRGNNIFHPLVSLAIGVIQPDPTCYNSYHQIADLASKAKSEAKKQTGNSLFICRRQKLDEFKGTDNNFPQELVNIS